jgi:putative hydrolase of the HAD superfamily
VPEIRAVLFDFGGVILSSPFEAFSRFERERGLLDGFLRSVNATDPDRNAWARLERSEISLDEFGEAFAEESAALGHRVDGREVLGLLMGDLRPAMVEALRRCHQHPDLVTALITNNFVLGDGHVDRESEMAPVLALFDLVLESSKVGIRKPDPAIFELACDRLGVTPAEAVFLDDLGVNLKPARAMGMTTIKVVDPDDALTELEAVLGFPLR